MFIQSHVLFERRQLYFLNDIKTLVYFLNEISFIKVWT